MKVVKKELCELIRRALVREYGTTLSEDDTDRMLADAAYRSVRRYLRKKQII